MDKETIKDIALGMTILIVLLFLLYHALWIHSIITDNVIASSY